MVAGRDPARTGRFAADNRVPESVVNPGAVFADPRIDAVYIATPHITHAELSIAALEAGKPVLCEKPMAMNTAEAQEMLDTAARLGLKLGIDFSYRFNPQSRAMKDLVDAGRLGEIYYGRSVWLRRRGVPGLGSGFNTKGGGAGSWFFDKSQSGGGPLIDLGVHRLDLALWLMGYPEPAWVMGSTYCKIAGKLAAERGLDYTVEDLACAMIKFKNGATLELDAAWASNIKENEQMSTRILGDKGGLYQYNLNEGYTWDAEYYQDMEGRQFDSKLHSSPEVRNAFWLFADAVRDDTPFLVQPEEGVVVMRLLDAIYESARTGEPVKF